METPTNEDLECLNGWPVGTVGYNSDKQLISLLNALCKKHGYGMIPQLCNWIEDIWRNPDKLQQYKNMRESRLRSLRGDTTLTEDPLESE